MVLKHIKNLEKGDIGNSRVYFLDKCVDILTPDFLKFCVANNGIFSEQAVKTIHRRKL